MRVFYHCGALPQPSRNYTEQYRDNSFALCSDGNIKLCRVRNAVCCLPGCTGTHIAHILCKYCANVHFYVSSTAAESIKMHLVSYNVYSCNCSVATRVSGTFSLFCEMGTQCLLLYLNTLIKQCQLLLLLRWGAAYSTAIAWSAERVGRVFIHTGPTQLIYPPNNWYLLR